MKYLNKKAFTLIELLVVVLIIGILAAIAVPQYQKAVMKSDLHRGISLVESIYQAQQAYYLTHGDFATNFDNLDISLPIDSSCTKGTNPQYIYYSCKFGVIGIYDKFSNIQFLPANNKIAYLHFIKDNEVSSINTTFEKDKRYCFAKPNNDTANSICQNMGGNLVAESGAWKYYKLDQ